MAIKDGDLIRELTTTTGTGNLTLSGAAPGQFTAFSDYLSTNDQAYYYLHDANNSDWEKGLGTLLSPTSFQRTTVLASTNGGAAISLTTGTHTIICSPTSGYQTGDIDGGGLTYSNFNAESYAETVATPSISSGVLTLDLSLANNFNVTWNANITSIVVTNAKSSGLLSNFVLVLTNNATGGYTIAYPSSFKFSDATEPTLSTVANTDNELLFRSYDAGTTWRVSLTGRAFG